LKIKSIKMITRTVFSALIMLSASICLSGLTTAVSAQHPGSFEGLASMNDGEHYTVLEESERIVKYSYATGEEVELLFSLTDLEGPEISAIDDYQFSQDEQMILLTTGMERIYRRSFTAEYYIWDIREETLSRLSSGGKQQLAEISPDNLNVAFVRENNLYIRDLDKGTESQITRDGKYNQIINGAPDWVYEEEFGFSKAWAWSPDGKKIAYYRFDEAHVKLFNMTTYGELYPEWYQFKYPKAGEENSVVSLHVFHLADQQTVEIQTGEEKDQYLPRIEWTTDPEQLAFIRLNRLQNKLDLFLADAASGESDGRLQSSLPVRP